ncbi:alpha/beta hydrolase [Mobilicoccus sp.]|uniref:alpha/beta fold hydrolase n=1 Tax=Mobilicoccus sp. TaxID=2034349 RepID=UPI0028B120DE|nr:alpha/beta hydrolase [Mobilicoccus sp.]
MSEHAQPIVLTRAGCPVHAWLSGPPVGPLVVLLHGATMNHGMFDAQVPALVSAGYRVLAVDQRGHGRSRPIGQVPFSVPDLAEDTVALAEAVGHTRFSVVGQSMGGLVGQDLLLRHPERVVSLVVIGASCATARLTRWERWGLGSSTVVLRLWPMRHLARVTARSIALTAPAQRFVQEAIASLSKRDFLTIWRAVAHSMREVPGYHVRHPLMLLCGEADRSGNVAVSMRAWAARDPHADYRVVPDAAHNANQDAPEVVNAAILEFLGRSDPAR